MINDIDDNKLNSSEKLTDTDSQFLKRQEIAEKNKIYIILINYKGHNDTVECLESLLKLNYSNFQIIVVDNSPDTDSINYLEAWAQGNTNTVKSSFEDLVYPLYPKPVSYKLLTEANFLENSLFTEKILFVKAIKNNGFAAGNNLGLKYIVKCPDFEYVWLLNNDTVVEKNTLGLIVNQAIKFPPNTAIIGNSLLYYHNPAIIQALGGKYLPYLGRSIHVEGGKVWNSKKKFSFNEANYVVGASMFLSKKIIEKVGFLDENYFLYFEEIDYMARAKKLGYKLGFVFEAKVYHKEGMSIGANAKSTNKLADFYNLRNAIILTKKHFKRYSLFVTIVYFLILFKRIIFKKSSTRNFLTAVKEGLRA